MAGPWVRARRRLLSASAPSGLVAGKDDEVTPTCARAPRSPLHPIMNACRPIAERAAPDSHPVARRARSFEQVPPPQVLQEASRASRHECGRRVARLRIHGRAVPAVRPRAASSMREDPRPLRGAGALAQRHQPPQEGYAARAARSLTREIRGISARPHRYERLAIHASTLARPLLTSLLP